MSLRRSLLLTVMLSGFALTGCETLGLSKPDAAADQSAPPAPVASVAPDASAPAANPAPAASVVAKSDKTDSETIVGRQIAQLRGDLSKLQNDVSADATALNDAHEKNQTLATNYYSTVAEINAKLETGTTPGNPRLVQRWQDASAALDQFAATGNDLNALSSRIAASASMANYLLDATRATYGLSGAVEEDHRALQGLEDDVQRSVIGIGRVLTNLTRDIDRQNAYIASERRNLQTLSLAIARGEVYGQSLQNVSSFRAPPIAPRGDAMDMTRAPSVPVASENLSSRSGVLGQVPAQTAEAAPAPKTPFVIIRFDRPDVDYGQPLYQAMSQALEKNPLGSFNILAVSPQGSDAKQTLAGTTARSKAEDVMRTMAEMGVPADRMQLTTATSSDATSPEVHLFLK